MEKKEGALYQVLHTSDVQREFDAVKREAHALADSAKKRKRVREDIVKGLEKELKTAKGKKLLKRVKDAYAEDARLERIASVVVLAASQKQEQMEKLKADALHHLGARLERTPMTDPLSLSVFYTDMTIKERARADEGKSVKMNRDAQRRVASGKRG